eukprot:13583357-Ditylum_brightwellii.AAC.1
MQGNPKTTGSSTACEGDTYIESYKMTTAQKQINATLMATATVMEMARDNNNEMGIPMEELERKRVKHRSKEN